MECTIIRSNRKTLAIQIKTDLSIVVRAPKRATMREIEAVLKEKEPWILKNLEKLKTQKALNENIDYLTDSDMEVLAKRASIYIPQRVKYFADIMGVTYGYDGVTSVKVEVFVPLVVPHLATACLFRHEIKQ